MQGNIADKPVEQEFYHVRRETASGQAVLLIMGAFEEFYQGHLLAGERVKKEYGHASSDEVRVFHDERKLVQGYWLNGEKVVPKRIKRLRRCVGKLEPSKPFNVYLMDRLLKLALLPPEEEMEDLKKFAAVTLPLVDGGMILTIRSDWEGHKKVFAKLNILPVSRKFAFEQLALVADAVEGEPVHA